MIAWAGASVAALEVSTLGPAGHHAPEDAPNEIGAAISDWMERHELLNPK
jgi:haloalkane dehalogenase